MTWQEELRKLDEDFSSGTITADEYRVRRDQVLSSAVAPPQEPQDDGENLEATQIVRPAQPPQRPQQSAPQPPPPPSAADATQIVPSSDNPDATQIVRNAAGSDPTPQYSVPDADRTQAVPHWETQQAAGPQYGPPQQDMYQPSPPYGVPQQHPPSPAGGFPQPGYQHEYPQQPHHPPQQQPQWHSAQTQDEATPLWGGDEFPPIAPPSEPDWVTQGPEFAKDPEEKGRTGKIVGAVLAVVLLAGIAFGAWMLWGQDNGDPSANPDGGGQTSEQPPPSKTSSAPSSPAAPPDPLPIAELPGQPEEHPEVTTFSDMEDKNYFNSKELKAYDRAGVGATKFHVQHLGSDGDVTIVLASTDSGKDGAPAVKQLSKIQVQNGSKADKDAPANVQVTVNTQNKKRPEIRAHYLSGNVIVRLELRSEKSLKAAREAFDEVLNAQLEELPADGG